MTSFKRILSLAALMMLLVGSTAAADKNLFNHMSLGLNIGMNGVGIDMGLPMTNYFALRAGYNWFPKLKYSTPVDLKGTAVSGAQTWPDEIDVQGKLNLSTAHALIDFYPSKEHGFHFTVGAYFGQKSIVDVYNKEPGALRDVYNYNHTASGSPIGVSLGDYLLVPDSEGNVAADFRVRKVRPYMGIGFGHAVPKGRFTCQFDLGVQFWNKPEVWVKGDNGEHPLEKQDMDNDSGKLLKFLSKLSVYPVLNLRIVGRLF